MLGTGIIPTGIYAAALSEANLLAAVMTNNCFE
jgi:hypothetical protein